MTSPVVIGSVMTRLPARQAARSNSPLDLGGWGKVSDRNLPPLQADTSYRVADFQYFEYSHASIRQPLTGEDTSILRLHLKNRTILDLSLSDEQLKHMQRTLIAAFPADALAYIKTMPWAKEHLRQDGK